MYPLPTLPKNAKLGIMGGTFDPIHNGHLMIAEQMRDEMQLDAVLFIPAGTPHFKIDAQGASKIDRLCMTRLAIASNPFFFASDIEIARPGITYTADTLKELSDFYPHATTFYFITGADAIAKLPCWKDASEIANMAELVATSRGGYDLEKARASIEASSLNCTIHYKQVPNLAISSTDVRKRVALGKTIRYLVPDAVYDYIVENNLYQTKQVL